VRTVTFVGSPVGGERVVVTVNGRAIVYTAQDTDTPETIAQNVSETIMRIGRGGHHGNTLRAVAGHIGAGLKIHGEHPGPGWEPTVTAQVDPPLSVSVCTPPRRPRDPGARVA
jgi:hypothetical protein